MLPRTEKAKTTATKRPNPLTEVSISLTTPPVEWALNAMAHSGTLPTAPPMVAPKTHQRDCEEEKTGICVHKYQCPIHYQKIYVEIEKKSTLARLGEYRRRNQKPSLPKTSET
jgi:hypothetical protein